jgi:8-oxo-dGTP diphosphatase
MERKPTFIAVVAAAIADGDGRLLLQQALPGKRHAGQWEFPGGKVESGETPRFALCREVAEELGLELAEERLAPAGFAEEAPIEGRPGIVLFLYTCSAWRGSPEGREGQRWDWFSLADAALLDLPLMDRALLAELAGKPIAKPDSPHYVAPSNGRP